MANHVFTNKLSLEKKVVELYVTLNFNGTANPTVLGNTSTLANKSKGVRSVVRTGIGFFTIFFGNSNATQSSTDLYSRVLFFESIGIGAIAGVAIGVRLQAINVSAASGSIDFELFRQGTSVDPAVGTQGLFRIVLKNSDQ